MAKKIRFPLNLAEGKQARDLTELREFFSLPEVLGYVANGKLVTWLSDRYETDLAEEISALDSSGPDFEKKVCEVLGVEYQGGGVTLADAQARNEKLAKLKEFTDEKKFLDCVDAVAFEQDDIYDLLDEDCNTIYLCGDKFTVPLAKTGVTYIGVNYPTLVISSKEVVDFGAKKLIFEGVVFDEPYQKLLITQEEKREEETHKKLPLDELQKEKEKKQQFVISYGGLVAYKGSSTSVVIPDTVTIIKANAFNGCHKVRKVTVPSSVKTIESGAFTNCKSLHQVIVQGGGTYLQRDALPSRVLVNDTSYGSNAQPVLNITGRNVGKKEKFEVSRGVLMGYEGSCALVVIPDFVTIIKANAFHGCHSVTKVIIPSSVKTIESGAFTNCKSLFQATIQGGGTYVQRDAFPSRVHIK